jgi:hypothetical protein
MEHTAFSGGLSSPGGRRRQTARGTGAARANAPAARRLYPAIILAAAVVLGAGPAGEAPAEERPKPGFEKGPLQTVAEPLKNILRLTFAGGRLRLDRDYWATQFQGKTRQQRIKKLADKMVASGVPRRLADRRAERTMTGPNLQVLFQQLKAAAGSASSSTSSSGSRTQMSFSGRSLSASLAIDGEKVDVRVQEQVAPSRVLLAGADETGSLRITLLSPGSDLVLVVSQAADGQVKVVHIRGEEVLRGRGRTFLAYYRQNRRYVEDELLPLLAHVGIALELSPGDPRVAEAVLSALRRPVTPQEIARAKQLIEQLGGDSYAQRAQATKELSANYARYRRFIDEALAEAARGPEVTSRLRKIAAENRGREKTARLIADLGLLDDPNYLVELLGRTTGRDRELVAARLERITKRKLGTDLSAWRKVLRSGEAATTAPSPPKK